MSASPKWLQRDAAFRAQITDRSRRWLVTGAAGFIGSNIVEFLLANGQMVRGFDNFATGHRRNLDEIRMAVGDEAWARFEFVQGDIRDPAACMDAMRGIDHVLHQAALGSVPRSIEDPLTTNAVNIGGFLNMLDAARRSGVPSFVYAASSSTYGDEKNLPKVEDRIGRALSPYAVSKAVNEQYAGVYATTFGLNATGLRYFNVYGRRQDPEGAYAAVIPRWTAAMLREQQVIINGDGETTRDFCYVEDAVQANVRAALATPASAEVYNVAAGRQNSLNTLFALLRGALAQHGHHHAIEPAHGAQRAGDIRHSLADVSKAGRELNYQPSHELAQGIEAAMPWYIDHLRTTS